MRLVIKKTKFFFWNFVNYGFENSLKNLIIAKFVYNNNKSAFIKLSWFFTGKKLHFCKKLNVVQLSNINTSQQILDKNSKIFKKN